MSLFLTIILDGVGVGEQPDAAQYGDEGSNTLGHVCEVACPQLPHLEKLGLGCIIPLDGIASVEHPTASYGKMREVSAGKDSTTGHWELGGIKLGQPFPTFPDGFPDSVIQSFVEKVGVTHVLGNRPASGTAIIDELGAMHQDSGMPIVYTSADSVFQVAAHKETIPLDELYRMCAIAREEVCVGDATVGRVIARPFVGTPGNYKRISAERKDYALLPPSNPVQVALREAGIRTVSIGKIADLFGGLGFDEKYKTKSNAEGMAATLRLVKGAAPKEDVFIWVNLVDFDQEFGHRNNPAGFANALEEFDRFLPDLLESLPYDSTLIITADHGNDPTTPGTDHSREYVPVLKYTSERIGKALGLRRTFADHAATVASFFDVPFVCDGERF